MFTGIIEEVGTIKKVVKKDPGLQLDVFAEKIMDDVKMGDSIAVNGVCLTVIQNTKKTFSFDLVNETLQKSNLGDLSQGDTVNLERAMKINGRFAGHIIQGHVETLGIILDKYH